jgi:galactitol PTS system EIIA component
MCAQSIFNQECMAINLRVENSDKVILFLAGLLEREGFVGVRYGQAVVNREKSFPTGVPAQPFSIAFPHAEFTAVYRSSLALAILAQPVPFRSMEDPAVQMPVRAVFLLANRTPKEQVTLLKRLARFFRKPQNLTQLLEFTEPGSLTAWLNQAFIPKS